MNIFDRMIPRLQLSDLPSPTREDALSYLAGYSGGMVAVIDRADEALAEMDQALPAEERAELRKLLETIADGVRKFGEAVLMRRYNLDPLCSDCDDVALPGKAWCAACRPRQRVTILLTDTADGQVDIKTTFEPPANAHEPARGAAAVAASIVAAIAADDAEGRELVITAEGEAALAGGDR